MEKINIVLTSGSAMEKPLVSAFKGSTGSYVVLDNEANGTMGLPIILVARFNNNKLEKINDQNEWNAVKECLRNIIAGNQMDYIQVPNQLIADDGFFSQLTLPVASFESLKTNYKPMGDGGATAPMADTMPAGDSMMAAPTPSAPIAPEAPVAPAVEQPVMPETVPNVMPSAPVTPQPMPNVAPMPEPVVTPVEQPIPTPEPVAPVMPEAPVSQMDAVPVQPVPDVNPIPESSTVPEVDFTAEKEAFLKACENMFDALVAKFNK